MGLFDFFTQEIAIDLGTANTLIIHNDQVMVDEPSIVAIDRRTGAVIAVGNKAMQMHGKTHDNIRTIRPLKDGVIADFVASEHMIRELIKSIPGLTGRLFAPSLRMVICIPSGITEVEKRAVKDSAEHANAKEVYLIHEPMAAAIGAGLPVEQASGSMVVDIGGGTTDIAVFTGGALRHTAVIPLAGDQVTNDISQGLQVQFDVAERIKTLHGGLIATGADDRDQIELPNPMAQWENDRRTISRSELIGVMRPRVEEILEEVRARLDAAGFDHLPSQQIVLTGGGSQIPGLDGLASKILGQQVRLGRPLRVHGLPQAATGPGFSSAVGLALFAAHPQDEWWDFDIPADRYPARSLKRAVKWFKDNW